MFIQNHPSDWFHQILLYDNFMFFIADHRSGGKTKIVQDFK